MSGLQEMNCYHYMKIISILRHTNEQRVMINEKFYSIYDNFVSITEESVMLICI